MAELTLVFKTRAELEGGRQALEQTEKQIGKAKALGQEYAQLEASAQRMRGAIAAAEAALKSGTEAQSAAAAQAQELAAAIDQVRAGLEAEAAAAQRAADAEKQAQNTREEAEANIRNMSELTREAKEKGKRDDGGGVIPVPKGAAIATAAMAAAATAAKVAADGLKEYAEAQQAVFALDAALAQHGKLTGDYRVHLQELANEMEGRTSIAASNWINVLSTLTKHGFDGANIEQATDTVKNLAGVMGGDIEGAAMAFVRAMNGNTRSLAAYGIQVDEGAGKTELLNQLQQKAAQVGGGQLEARAKSLSGQYAGMKIALDNLSQSIGQQIEKTGVAQAAMGSMTEFLQLLAGSMSGPIGAFEDLKNNTEGVAQSAESAEVGLLKIQQAASNAADQVENLSNQFQKAQRQADELADVELAGKLAAIDLEEAQGAQTPEAAAGFAARRSKLRRDSESSKTSTQRLRAMLEADALQRQLQESEGRVAGAADPTAAAQAEGPLQSSLRSRIGDLRHTSETLLQRERVNYTSGQAESRNDARRVEAAREQARQQEAQQAQREAAEVAKGLEKGGVKWVAAVQELGLSMNATLEEVTAAMIQQKRDMENLRRMVANQRTR
jgi:hypothetical protein